MLNLNASVQTVWRQLPKARAMLKEAEDDLWEAPDSPVCYQRVKLWQSEVERMESLDPNDLEVMF